MMVFILKLSYIFFWFLINVQLTTLIVLTIGLFLLFFKRKKKWGLSLIIGGLSVFFFLSIFPLGKIMITHLENRIPKTVLPKRIDGLILLGGTYQLYYTQERKAPVTNMAFSRLSEFIELAIKYPKAKLLITGTREETYYTKLALMNVGIDSARLLLDENSKNTLDNAQLSFLLAKPAKGENWVLVTSAFHMPRSYGLFSRLNWSVIPYPVNYLSSGKYSLGLFRPDGASLMAFSTAMKEWAGMLNGYLSGSSLSLFPSLEKN